MYVEYVSSPAKKVDSIPSQLELGSSCGFKSIDVRSNEIDIKQISVYTIGTSERRQIESPNFAWLLCFEGRSPSRDGYHDCARYVQIGISLFITTVQPP